MSRTKPGMFTPGDLDRIAAAVTAAERETSGEIVPYIVDASDTYERTMWKGSALGGFLSLVGALAVQWAFDWWPSGALLNPAGLGMTGLLLGAILPIVISSIRRTLAGSDLMEERSQARARQAFLDEAVFATRDRTGILIFVTLFERRVIVLADTGISDLVPRSEWDAVVATVLDGIRTRDHAGGMIRAIERCGAILTQYRVGAGSGGTNELRNDLRRRP